jgi:hypothetical protein
MAAICMTTMDCNHIFEQSFHEVSEDGKNEIIQELESMEGDFSDDLEQKVIYTLKCIQFGTLVVGLHEKFEYEFIHIEVFQSIDCNGKFDDGLI